MMSIEVIPAGSSVVVTEKDYARDAERVKDVLATMSAAAAVQTQNLTQDIKDAESRLDRSAGDRFINTIQDIKDAETRLDKTSGDRFIQTIQDIKEAAKDVALSGAHTVEVTKDVEFELEKSVAHTREMMANQFKYTDVEMLKQFKSTDLEIARKFESTQRQIYENDLRNLSQFKDQALLSEKLAAHQELLSSRLAAEAAAKAAECCCELKTAILTDGQKTRDLLNSITEQNLRDRAQRSEAALAAYFAAKVAPTSPV
jgi:hypothetical protein